MYNQCPYLAPLSTRFHPLKLCVTVVCMLFFSLRDSCIKCNKYERFSSSHSCGNRVYSVNADGSLRWISKEYGSTPPNYGILLPPAIHPKGYVFIIHYNHTTVLAFSTDDGSLYQSYEVPHLLYLEPPILLGNALMYLMGYTTAENPDSVIYAVKI